ncbi:MAG TPA: glycoside-pentoside-hexuronide (GPH):cation symporter [Candidatus Limiplasma sp.]|nr:glycoside-pentoside-hexuronide (GPH):cation symporter [Candidatus Limiplasma sp.]HRX09011.1 glycoside-pentoside-hexuronide (GPH):cation symporter [Candidatus Limiplasma sp.]
MSSKIDTKNRYFFGLGTIGRDMFYSMVSMYVLVYITEVRIVTDATLAVITVLLLVLRTFDAFNDPLMGLIVDNTHSRFGKFKPWILVGGLIGGVSMVLMFTDLGLSGTMYIITFGFFYVVWDVFYGLNDIAYWSMMPSLTTDQHQREKIGSFARICANIGMFAVVVGIVPLTNALSDAIGSPKDAWFWFAVILAVAMMGFLLFTLLGVKERKGYFKQEEKTTIKEMFHVIVKNDQLLWVAVSMSLFMIGYMTTTSFGLYFFKYAYGNQDMYAIFALVLGVSQLLALSVFTKVRTRFSRRKLYAGATMLVVAGYVLFFVSSMSMAWLGAAGILIFIGEAFIQMLMLMFLTDTIEYGQLKLGKRNESITFSVQPFINKIGGAIASGVVGLTLILSGINKAQSAAEVTAEGILIMKIAMLILPLISILLGYIIYLKKFRIHEEVHAKILQMLRARGDIEHDV